MVVKVESRVASIGTKGLGAGFSVPIEDLGISVGTGLAGSKSKVEHESVVWVKQEDQKETRFVFGVSVHAPWVSSLKIGLAEIPRVC